MDSISFSQLNSYQCAFIDITSLSNLAKYIDWFSEDIKTKEHYELFKKQAEKVPFQNALNILERMVAYEFVVVDELVLPTLESQLAPTELIKKTAIPEIVYLQAADRVLRLHRREFVGGFGSDDDWFDGEYKNHIDEIHKVHQGVGQIADTNQSLARVLFYLELSAQAKVPVFLNPTKDKFIKLYEDKFRKEVLKIVETAVEKNLKKGIEEVLESSYGTPIPPLAEYIIEKAYKDQTSCLKSMSNIRSTKPAKEFRNWLWEIQEKLFQGTRADWLGAANAMKKFTKAVTEWAKTFDVDESVTHRTASIKVGPRIPFIEIKGLEKDITVKDPILDPPLYLTFIISWYKKPTS